MNPAQHLRRRAAALAALLAAAAPAARALGPQEMLLLVNENSPASLEIANRYVAARGIPRENVLYLPLPDSARSAEAECSPEEFTKRIWEPASAAAHARGLEDHLVAWVFSADFPVRITTSPPVSLQGLVFARNRMPESGLVTSGLYASATFAGPGRAGGRQGPSVSIENLAASLGLRMPLASMALACTGTRGNEPAVAWAALERAVRSDGTRPSGSVYFLQTADVRTTCRAWQFEGALAELAALGVRAVVTSNFPAGARDVAGLMAGQASADCASIRSFAPGAVADNLTSWGAMFHNPEQTKLTGWLAAGASASAGTVVEPYSLWTKFPHARFFAHYARGCALLNSYVLSVACPMQLMLVGDPLACPWAPPLRLTLTPVADGPVRDKTSFVAKVEPEASAAGGRYLTFVDGRFLRAAPASRIDLDASALRDGYHEVFVAFYTEGAIRHQANALCGFVVDRQGRSARIVKPEGGSAGDARRPFEVQLAATGAPARLGVFSRGRLLADAPGPGPATVTVDPARLGAGPVELQAVAMYADGGPVAGLPVTLALAVRNTAPEIRSIASARNPDKSRRLVPEIRDADGDRVAVSWLRPVFAGGVFSSKLPEGTEVAGGTASPARDGLELAAGASNRFAVCALAGAATCEFSAEVTTESAGAGRGRGGLVYDFKDSMHFSFFGFLEDRSAWAIGESDGADLRVTLSRGVPWLGLQHWPRLIVKQTEDGSLECWAGDERIFRQPRPAAPLGRTGFFAGPGAVRFRQAAQALAPDAAGFTRDGDALLVVPAGAGDGRLRLRATDGFSFSEKECSW